ncbi:nitric oxide reductase transcriptional regulator NorR [Shewanella sp. 1CM18E]|uniref:nitric oxide reductase transcriptional regulator NorR n=1 Tax=Shewanella sp. 1CM18E TaxID=2929169 RepID=UPI0020BD98D6|nr:nitric oxide reductase transcriptional regulator NorR [Shewanella sp. 1CM18E]MCK8044368.1 nitric oxide reductase transcriptional regulator NorR [Shewanella sp. 1CM18E]
MANEQIDKAWFQVALDITSALSAQDRFERLLATVRHTLNCDASALLMFRQQQFIPLAINGLSEDVLGRRFALEQHPRLEVIARAGDIVRFPSDSDLPDPYDGLIPNHDELKVHSCIGLPLMFDDRLIGAVTIDAFDPLQFNRFSNEELRIVSALAASSLNMALLMEQLERAAGVQASGVNYSSKLQPHTEMIGQSPSMLELKAQVKMVANTDLSVLIMGETGVGKELVAQSLHSLSSRALQPLVYLNCAALPESVAESELFGHIKGAFTGAISNRKGKFELADNGTLFLDEIGELSLPLQAKLLRALQYGDIQRVGDDRNIKVNVRIVAATNRVMHEEVKNGHFRADLYHRLSVFPLFVPALRERGQDIVLLAGFFAERCAHKLGVNSINLAAASLASIRHAAWPGNVRELEHAINRAAVIARANSNAEQLTLLPSHFSQQPTLEPSSVAEHTAVMDQIDLTQGLKSALDQFQTELIEQTLKDNNGNLSAAARQLQINSGNLHRLMKRLNLK